LKQQKEDKHNEEPVEEEGTKKRRKRKKKKQHPVKAFNQSSNPWFSSSGSRYESKQFFKF